MTCSLESKRRVLYHCHESTDCRERQCHNNKREKEGERERERERREGSERESERERERESIEQFDQHSPYNPIV